MPSVSDIYSYYALYVFTKDPYHASNGETYVQFYLYIYPNRVPYLQYSLPDVSLTAGEPISYSFVADTFVDDDQETITYSVHYPVNNPSSWLSFDSATRTFSGTPTVNTDVGTYIVTVRADDTNPNSAAGEANFTITVTQNYIPQLDQGLTAATDTSVFYEFSYVVPTDAFMDPEGDTMTIRVEVDPPNFSVAYTDVDRTVRGTLSDNTLYGDYTLTFHVEDIWNASTFTHTLPIKYLENFPPVVNTPAPDPSCIIAHYLFDYSIPMSYYSDVENEALTATFNVADSKGSWVSMAQNSTHFIFSGTPDNSQFGNYTLDITIEDPHPTVSGTTDSVEI